MTSYSDVALAYFQQGLLAIPAKGKAPVPRGATGREGTVTEEKMIAWCSDPEWKDQNTALKSDGSWIAIDVDAYGDKQGGKTIAELEVQLGELPVTISSTAREPWLADGTENPSRQHFYLVPMGMKFLTKLPDVEVVQAHHRFSIVYPSRHPDTGAQYTFYDYDGEPLEEIPGVGDFEMLPEAWVNYLAAPEAGEFTRTVNGVEYANAGFGGSVKEWLDQCEAGEPSPLVKFWVASIPQSDFGHDEMIALQSSLVNLAVQLETGIEWAMTQLQGAWLRGQYNTPDYRRDWETSLAGAIAKYGAFPPRQRDIPKIDHLPLIEAATHPDFFDRMVTIPTDATNEQLEQRLLWIASRAFEDNYQPFEVAALVYRSAAGREIGLQSAENGLDGALYYMTEAHRSPIDEEGVPRAPVPEILAQAELIAQNAPNRPVRLLTNAEDGALENIRWWGDEFMEVMAELNNVMTESYYRLLRWITLSLVFANRAVVRRPNGSQLLLNIYGGSLGDSNTGKTEARDVMIQLAEAYYEVDTPDIGSNATSAALAEKLMERNGKTSLFHSDEADKIMRDWSNSQGPFSDMKQMVTELYTGRIPKYLRRTNKEMSGIDARAFLSVYVTGVWDKVSDSIETEDWISGFLNRFVWVMGKSKTLTREQKRFQILQPGQKSAAAGGKNWYATWVAQWRRISNTILQSPTNQPIAMGINEDVLVRHIDTVEAMERIQNASPFREQVVPTFKRMEQTIMKCACLVAITEGRTVVQMSDYLIALRQGEEWAANSLALIEATHESRRAREMRKLEAIIGQNGGRMEIHQIKRMSQYSGQSRYVNDLLQELEDEHRVGRMQQQVGIAPYVHLIKEGAA